MLVRRSSDSLRDWTRGRIRELESRPDSREQFQERFLQDVSKSLAPVGMIISASAALLGLGIEGISKACFRVDRLQLSPMDLLSRDMAACLA